MRNVSPNRFSSSSRHCKVTEGGHATTTLRTFCRMINSRTIRPASIVFPIGPGHDLSIELLFPKHFQLGALSIIVQARETNQRLFRRNVRADYFLDQVLPRPDFDDCARFWSHPLPSRQARLEEQSLT